MQLIEGIKNELSHQGYSFIPCWEPESDTEVMVQSIGDILKISEIRGYENVPDVQTLKPREVNRSLKYRYSSYYGMGDFPLHTDLAHWLKPPRYLVLRCIIGSESVVTNILSSSILFEKLGANTINKAIVKLRRNTIQSANCLLPVLFSEGDVQAIRWDSLFLVPMNRRSQKTYDYLNSGLSERDIIEKKLVNPGDTLIIDNWTVLHGRSMVNELDRNRLVERVYLTQIGK